MRHISLILQDVLTGLGIEVGEARREGSQHSPYLPGYEEDVVSPANDNEKPGAEAPVVTQRKQIAHHCAGNVARRFDIRGSV